MGLSNCKQLPAIEANSQISNNLSHLNVSHRHEYDTSRSDIYSSYPVSAHVCLHGVRFTPVQFNTQDGEADLVEFAISYCKKRRSST